MATDQVNVTPSVLVWARESIGLSRDEAARQLNMTPIALQFLEEGVGDVSMPRLRRMAKVYDRPLVAFFLTEPLADHDELPDSARRPGASVSPGPGAPPGLSTGGGPASGGLGARRTRRGARP